MKIGDIISWKGRGPLFTVLSSILSLFDSEWRHRFLKPRQMAIVVGFVGDDPLIFEATAPRCRIMPLSVLKQIYGEDYRVYPWFDKSPPQKAIDAWVYNRLGALYDPLVYCWTILQYLFAKRNICIPRILNDRYSCWELAAEFCNDFGKPWNYCIGRKHPYPMINEFLKECEGIK